MYSSTKTYTPEEGLSCVFRQWRAADSHCSRLHGYAIGVALTFEAATLDGKNWVVDFGGMKRVKDWLKETFDHKLLIARDDPAYRTLEALSIKGLADIVPVPATGCEAFAKYIYDWVADWLHDKYLKGQVPPRVQLSRVEVSEHRGNSAAYTGGTRRRNAHDF